jgi:LmbE family N-acetylglucosaminyl deacetylase
MAPNGPLLVVAPHFDDAALSCAALLARSEAVDVLTVFGGEPNPPRQGYWDARCGFASSAESLRARRREEQEAFAGSPHRISDMDLVEDQYLESPRAQADAELLAGAVAQWIARVGGGTVAIPAGAGRRTVPGPLRRRLERLARRQSGPPRHPDHVFVRDAALSALGTVERAVPLLYEELPYLWGGGADREVRRVARAHRRKPVQLQITVDREAKARRIAAYRSQVAHLRSRGVCLDVAADLPAVERYWRLVRHSRSTHRS